MCSPCFCFFTRLSRSPSLWTGHQSSTFITSFAVASLFYSDPSNSHPCILSLPGLTLTPLLSEVRAPPLQFSPPVPCFHYRSLWEFHRGFCLRSSLSPSIATETMKGLRADPGVVPPPHLYLPESRQTCKPHSQTKPSKAICGFYI